MSLHSSLFEDPVEIRVKSSLRGLYLRVYEDLVEILFKFPLRSLR